MAKPRPDARGGSPEDRRARFAAVPRIFAKLAFPPSCDFCGKVLGKGAGRLVAARPNGTFSDAPNICDDCLSICNRLCEDDFARK